MSELSTDEKANELAELVIKRDRTLGDLDAVEKATLSALRSIETFGPRNDEVMQSYAERAQQADLSNDERRTLYMEWSVALRSSAKGLSDLIQEWERLQVQEGLLAQIIAGLDNEIERLRRELEGETP